jgi:hypothetical protein
MDNITTKYVWCLHNCGNGFLCFFSKVLQPLFALDMLNCTDKCSGTFWRKNAKWPLTICSWLFDVVQLTEKEREWLAPFYTSGHLIDFQLPSPGLTSRKVCQTICMGWPMSKPYHRASSFWLFVFMWSSNEVLGRGDCWECRECDGWHLLLNFSKLVWNLPISAKQHFPWCPPIFFILFSNCGMATLAIQDKTKVTTAQKDYWYIFINNTKALVGTHPLSQ